MQLKVHSWFPFPLTEAASRHLASRIMISELGHLGLGHPTLVPSHRKGNVGKTSILQRVYETTESPRIYRSECKYKKVRAPSFCLRV